MIYISKGKGLCKGINHTLEVIYNLYEDEIKKSKPRNIYIYKDFVFNNLIKEELNNLGIKIIDDLSILTEDDILVITCLGISKDNLKYLKDNKITYYDTTCKVRDKINNNIIKYQNKGYLILSTVDLNNLEVLTVKEKEDLSKINQNTKLYVINYLNKKEELIDFIKDKFKDVIIDDYNCPSYEELINNNNELKEKYQNVINIKDYTKEEFIEYILNSNYTFNDDIALIGELNNPLKELNYYKYLLTFLLFYKDRLQELINNQNLLNSSLINEDDNNIIKKVINDFIDLNKDGKYLRGVLIALGEYIKTKKTEHYLNLATAYETFETSILIHDDIIDNAKLRRGKMTIPRRICQEYLNKGNYNDTIKLANSIGICLGDYGLFIANKIIYDKYQDFPSFNKLLKLYNEIVIKTIKGEVLDVYLPYLAKQQKYNVKEQDILNIYQLKTSLYTIVGPFALGCALSEEEIPKDLEEILINIGIYYQIKDDILSIFKNSNQLGKTNTSDIEEFKQTLLYTYIINTSYKNEFLKLYGKKKITNKELSRVRELLKDSGALKYTEDYLDNIYYDLLIRIDKLNINIIYRDLLKGLLIYFSLR